jgi:hypothetical protein
MLTSMKSSFTRSGFQDRLDMSRFGLGFDHVELKSDPSIPLRLERAEPAGL